MTYTYKYSRPAVTVDLALFTNFNKEYKVLLIKRKNDPYKGSWALPGGFVDENESPDDALIRESKEEISADLEDFFQFKTYGTPGRDPRGHTVSIVYVSFCKNKIKLKAGDDASEYSWFEIDKLPELSFDHKEILDEIVLTFRTRKFYPVDYFIN